MLFANFTSAEVVATQNVSYRIITSFCFLNFCISFLFIMEKLFVTYMNYFIFRICDKLIFICIMRAFKNDNFFLLFLKCFIYTFLISLVLLKNYFFTYHFKNVSLIREISIPQQNFIHQFSKFPILFLFLLFFSVFHLIY